MLLKGQKLWVSTRTALHLVITLIKHLRKSANKVLLKKLYSFVSSIVAKQYFWFIVITGKNNMISIQLLLSYEPVRNQPFIPTKAMLLIRAECTFIYYVNICMYEEEFLYPIASVYTDG